VLKNKNRGYQQLRVWQDALELYKLNSQVFQEFPFELKRVASQAIASSDSVHRNIAEGYCRRSLKEYLNFLNIALGSLGESVSGLFAYQEAKQIGEEDFKVLNEVAYRLENGLLKLVESLERKHLSGDWIDHLIVKESNEAYGKLSKGDTED
jgi:four helix bundle protein